MSDDVGGSPKPQRKPSIGAKASSLRKQLQDFGERKLRIEAELREEKQKLAKDLNEAERREKRRIRNRELNDQKRLKFLLGGLALAALRRLGRKAFALAATDLEALPSKDLQLLDEALLIGSHATVRAVGASDGLVDIIVE